VSRRRQPSTPPDLPGYTYSRLLGMGGFADVFLYQQELPSRDVAVKVLLDTHLDDEARSQFVTEANLMAQVSQHPAIVTVHHAGFADDGRPYLIMEYCSRPGVAERYRTERMDVAESLRIAIRIASAVASAHKAGIWHRDIKPANVLTTDFGWPALTDFGIAATAAIAGSAVGMSIPWAPPELLSPSPSGDERSDVYSLAATLYSMLAGRSPFEVLGTANTAGDLVGRIERMPLPRILRSDVPDDLFEVLDTAMAKRAEDRHPSSIAFARDLQGIEADLGLPVTALDLVGIDLNHPASQPLPRVRPERPPSVEIPVVEAAKPVVYDKPPAAPTPAPAAKPKPKPKPAPAPAPKQPAPPPEPEDPADVKRTQRRIAAGAVAALFVIVVAIVVAASLGRSSQAGSRRPVSPYANETQAPAEVVPAPVDLVGTVSGQTATFEWKNPKPRDGDRYRWAQVEWGGATGPWSLVDTPSVTVPLGPDGRVCIKVSIMRHNRQLSDDTDPGCAP